jgi:DNA-binding Lrp family transcriptional regulator
MDLDVKDKKILFSIAEDAIKSRKQVAKEVHLSKDVVDYRINKLLANNIITMHPRINLSLFSYGQYFLLIQLNNADANREKEIINKLKKMDYCVFVGKTGGDFDIIFTFVVKDLEGLAKLIDDLDFINPNLKRYELYPVIKEYKESFKSRFSENYFDKKYIMFSGKYDFKIDDIDKKILYLISENINVTNSFISNKLNLSEEAVRIRLKNLEKRKIILNYRVFLNPKPLGLTEFALFMNFDSFDKALDKKLEGYFNANKEVVFANRLVGKYKVGLSIYAKSINELYAFIDDMKKVFQNNLKETSIVIIFSTEYYSHLPKGILD